jgi:DNA-binding LacI/PurR family transcriptional regulator/serine phosphatase RsbU (regulator of sigma subunit)
MGAGGRRTIALLFDRLSSEYAVHLRRSIERAASQKGVSVLSVVGQLLGDIDASAVTQNQIYELVSPDCVDGVIVVSATMGHYCGQDGLLALCRSYAPLPVCSVGVALPGIPSLVIDNHMGMREGVLHLMYEHGCSRIAFIGGQKESVESNHRLDGYLAAHKEMGITADPRLVRHGDFTVKTGILSMRDLLQSGVPFDAVVAANDDMALGALDVLADAGISVPRDVIVLGFDDINSAHFTRPSLSTLRQPMWWLGERAVDLILDQITGRDVPELQAGPVDLVRRESCGCGYQVGVTLHPQQKNLASVRDVIALYREPLTEAMRAAVAVPKDTLGNWPNQLLDALEQEFSGREGRFSEAFEEILDRAQREGASLDEFQRVVSVLRSEFRRFRLDKKEEDRYMDRVWHNARVLVGAASIRLLGRQKLEQQEVSQWLSWVGERLATSLSLSLLREQLVGSLAKLKVERCAVSLYTAPASKELKLLVACTEKGQLIVAQDKFNHHQMAPRAIFEGERAHHFVVMPISFETEMLGVGVFESGTMPTVYETLRQQVGSAVKGAILHREMVAQVTIRERLEKERIAGEARLAAEIQTSVQPAVLDVAELDLAAWSEPAAEAGGDYYDVLPASDGAWLAIGDVTGHGLASGLVMLMIQSMIAGLARQEGQVKPSAVVSAVGDALWDNVRRRLKRDDHATLTVLKYHGNGRFTYAGAHEDIIVWRKNVGKCEVIPTSGFWVGAVPSVRRMTQDAELTLELGDTLVLHTDGITEARNARHEQFSQERLLTTIEGKGGLASHLIRDAITETVRGWTASVDDDMTLLVVTYVGP